MKKIIVLTMSLMILFSFFGCSEQNQELVKEENMIPYAKEKLEIDEYYYDISSSNSRFYTGYMFFSHSSSKFVLYERPGAKEEGYLVLDSGSVICDQYGIDFKKYGEGRKVTAMFDEDSPCHKVVLECRANKKEVTHFDIEAPQILVIDLDEWGDVELIDYISFRAEDNTIIREERLL